MKTQTSYIWNIVAISKVLEERDKQIESRNALKKRNISNSRKRCSFETRVYTFNNVTKIIHMDFDVN